MQGKSRKEGSRARVSLLAVAVCLCAGAPLAGLGGGAPTTGAAPRAAGLPETPVLAAADPVSDDELAGVRGRFASGGEVVHFGLRMTSQVQSASGKLMQGQLNLTVDMSGPEPDVDFEPNVTVATEEVAEDAAREAANAAASAATGRGADSRAPGDSAQAGSADRKSVV